MKFKKIVKGLLLATLITSVTVGCGDSSVDDQDAFSGELRFAGSSTLAPTISQIADEFKSEYETWNNVDESLPEEEIRISVSTGGSGAGATAVVDNTADIGMLARATKEDEESAIEDYNEVGLGIDALLIAVNVDNPVVDYKTDYSIEEIRSIFSGGIEAWNQLDGSLPEDEVLLLVRDIGGGAHEVFQKSIMDDVDVSDKAMEMPSMTSLVERLIESKSAIGYASYGISDSNRDSITPFSIEGVEPTMENIVNGDYIISRPLNLIWSGELTVAEQAFLDYIKSSKGSDIVEEMGFISVD